MPRNQGNQAAWKQHEGPASLSGPFTASVSPDVLAADTAVFDPPANIVQNLPPAEQNVGRTITYVNAGSLGFSLTVQAVLGDTLNDLGGAASAMADGASVSIQAINSTTWQVVGSG